MVIIAIAPITMNAEAISPAANQFGIDKTRTAFTAKLIGLTLDMFAIQFGIAACGTKAVLMNSRGKVRKPPIPNTVSALRVLSPMANEMPDHASPKKAIVVSMTAIPPAPVATLKPRIYASTRMMEDWTTTLKASVTSLPSKIADLFTGVTSIFWSIPEFSSSTTDVPDCNALLKPFCSRIPGVAYSR